ncbi:hypothetical protein PVL29_014668 [Vitis rotundifolia]|uniref:Uncharacterized protein n=1 Tax=Vitis rotundifolia TaxID=103349 RepID=A0AA38ZHR1_VITRO|nr:hypothetical protein PVL29_014668 [Vitis rotundifolia]
MEKRVASGSGVQNKRPMKKNKKKWLKKVLDYLKSDSYMFAPLIFHPTNSAAASGVEMTKPIKEDNRTLLEKVEEYLKSDNYMYAPLIITQPMHVPAARAIESPQTGQEALRSKNWRKAMDKEMLACRSKVQSYDTWGL